MAKSKTIELPIELNPTGDQYESDKRENVMTEVVEERPPSPFRIGVHNFRDLTVKLNVKLHKSVINDLMFLDDFHSSTDNDPQQATSRNLPLVCSVSNDNWIKIYSLKENSVFRSFNVSDFNLSSVDCVQVDATELNTKSFDAATDADELSSLSDEFLQTSMYPERNSPSAVLNNETRYVQTLLFLSCWDNAIYIYDMNYNRCISSLNDAHDDALSRVKLAKLPHTESLLVLSSSWDSSVKVWLSSPIVGSRTNPKHRHHQRPVKLQFQSELTHDSSVLDFQLTKTYLASLCDDGNVHVWKLNKSSAANNQAASFDRNEDDESDEDELVSQPLQQLQPPNRSLLSLDETPDLENPFTFGYALEHTTDMGKITDCRIIDAGPGVPTIAVCSAGGYVKIYNAQTNSELFSIRINVPDVQQQNAAKLNKLLYLNDYILTVDTAGYIYFIDLKQQNGADSVKSNNQSPFLSHFIKLTSNSLHSICMRDDLIIAVGDSTGYLHLLSLFDI